MKVRFILITAIAAIGFGQAPHTGDVRVLSSNGVRAVMQELLPQCERAVGRKLAIEYSSAATLKQKIQGGEAFDVAILTTDVMDALIKDGKMAPGTRAEIARCGIGVGIRSGAPKPDIKTPEAIKQTLLKAKSITYTKDGASRVTIDKMFDRLGIAEQLKPKLILLGPSEPPERVAAGGAEIVMTLISEILPVKGVDLVGPLPGDLQNYVVFDAASGTHAQDTESSKKLIAFLTSPTPASTIKAKGMEPAIRK